MQNPPLPLGRGQLIKSLRDLITSVEVTPGFFLHNLVLGVIEKSESKRPRPAEKFMLYVFVTLFFFLDAVVMHLLVCRRKAQGLFLKLFFSIAFMNLVLAWVVFWFLPNPLNSGVENILTAPLYGTATVIYALLIPTYLIFYFSTQQTSPSKKILVLLAHNGPLSLDELLIHFSDQELIFPRIQDLITTRCVLEHKGWYVLTPSGTMMCKAYQIYQMILGRSKGG